MRARAILGWLLAAAALALVLGGRALGEAPTFKIIVHPDNPIETVDADFLRDAYLKKTGEWASGAAIHPLDLSTRFPARAQFTRDVLHKTPAQLRRYWTQQIFSGKRVPPPEVDSPAAAIAYVLGERGAVAYIPGDADPGQAKVVEVR